MTERDHMTPPSRRSFLSSMLQAGVACAFLPGAARHWTRLGSLFAPRRQLVIVPDELQWTINPDWSKASLDQFLVFNPGVFHTAPAWIADPADHRKIPILQRPSNDIKGQI